MTAGTWPFAAACSSNVRPRRVPVVPPVEANKKHTVRCVSIHEDAEEDGTKKKNKRPCCVGICCRSVKTLTSPLNPQLLRLRVFRIRFTNIQHTENCLFGQTHPRRTLSAPRAPPPVTSPPRPVLSAPHRPPRAAASRARRARRARRCRVAARSRATRATPATCHRPRAHVLLKKLARTKVTPPPYPRVSKSMFCPVWLHFRLLFFLHCRRFFWVLR